MDKKSGRDKNPRAVPWLVFLVFFLLIIGIVGAGVAFYLNQKSYIESDERQKLDAIAKLKVNQIENWLSERIGDGRMIQENRLIMDEVGPFLANPGDPKKSDSIRQWLESIRKYGDYQNALLTDAAGHVLLSALPKGASIGPEGLDLIAAARRSGRVMLSELHRSLEAPEIHQDLAIPVLGSPPSPGAEAGAAPVDTGAVLLRIDPYRFLYPLIQSWPVASESAETLLVKKEGNKVVYLNELRHRKNTALTLRLPITESGLPAALAVRGVFGIVEGIDYRGVPVLAALRPIPGTSWFMVAKVDTQEIFSGLRHTGLAIFTICLLLLVSSGSTVGTLWLRQSRLSLQKQNEAELERRALARHFDYLVRYANDILILADTDSRIVEVNDQAVRSYGYSREESLNLHLQDLRPKEQQGDLPRQMKQAAGRGGLIYETVHRRKDGSTFQAEVSARVIDIEGRAFYQHIIRDITERKRAEEAHRESIELYQRTLENMLEGCQIIDFDMRYLYVNSAAAKHGRMPREKLLGRTMMEVYPGIETTEMFAALQRCLADRTPVSMENKFTYSDGTSGYFELSIQTVPDGIFILSIDTTAHKLAEEALRKSQQEAALLAGLLEHSSQPFTIGYPDGSLGIFNAAFLDLVGYTKEEMRTIDWSRDLTPPEWHEIESAMLEDLTRTGLPVRYEKECIRRDGSRVPIELLVHLVRDEKGRPKHYYAFITDITGRKRAEDAVRQLTAELEQRVRERTAELETANRELEAFSYSVSHDLRTPLRAIDGFSRIVLEEYASALDPEARRLLGVIRGSTQHMGQLIDDLLDFSRLGRTEIHRSRIDVASMVRSVFEELLPPGEAGKTEFRIGSLPDAFSDPRLFRQVWTNLLSNAIKFSGKTERRVVEVGGMTDGDKNAYFVQDNGVGFDMRYNDKLFGVFQRLHSLQEFEGTGVGLAIVQRIVQRLGGRVWAQGRVGAGATFSFSLPRPTGDDKEEQHG